MAARSFRMRALALALALPAWLVGCGTAADTGPPPAAAAPAGEAVSAAPATVEERMLARINLYRSRNRLAPLAADAQLARAAAAHARAMAERDFFGHDDPDGTGFDARARRAGYAWRVIAENVAGGLASPEATVDSWMASEGHRLNMLNPTVRDAGIGHAYAADDGGRVRYRHYWTLLVGAAAAH